MEENAASSNPALGAGQGLRMIQFACMHLHRELVLTYLQSNGGSAGVAPVLDARAMGATRSLSTHNVEGIYGLRHGFMGLRPFTPYSPTIQKWAAIAAKLHAAGNLSDAALYYQKISAARESRKRERAQNHIPNFGEILRVPTMMRGDADAGVTLRLLPLTSESNSDL